MEPPEPNLRVAVWLAPDGVRAEGIDSGGDTVESGNVHHWPAS